MGYNKKMKPREPGRPLHVMVVGRVSTPQQDIENIEAGYIFAEKVLPEIWDGESIITRLGERASGMLVKRETMLEAYELIDEGWPDLVLMEDLSKAFRNPRWILAFVQDCVDADIRVIAPGDHLDTWEDNYEIVLSSAALRHGMHIPDTRRRVRRTSSKTFSEGGMVMKVRYGYRKLTKEEAATGTFGPAKLRIAKAVEATPVIQQLRRLVVEQKKEGRALAYWLNTQLPPIPTGPYSKSDEWTAQMVMGLLTDEILYGKRQFPKVIHTPINRSGEHRRSKNPDPPSNLYPCLAHMTKEEFDEMNAVLEQLGTGATAAGREHPRFQIPRTHAVLPFQFCVCSVCLRFMYLSGYGVMKCQNCREMGNRHCWNHVQTSCDKVREVVIDLLLEHVGRHPEGLKILHDTAWSVLCEERRIAKTSSTSVDREIKSLKAQAERLGKAIALSDKDLPTLVKQLSDIETQLTAASKKAKRKKESERATPQSRKELELDPRATLLELAATNFAFANFVRKIIPNFLVRPVQALDTGLVRPQGVITLDFGAMFKDSDPMKSTPSEQVIVDLFDPPKHIQAVKSVMALKQKKEASGQKASLKIIGRELGINHMTVKRAISYARLMQENGLDKPYRVLTEKPTIASRWRPPQHSQDDNQEDAA